MFLTRHFIIAGRLIDFHWIEMKDTLKDSIENILSKSFVFLFVWRFFLFLLLLVRPYREIWLKARFISLVDEPFTNSRPISLHNHLRRFSLVSHCLPIGIVRWCLRIFFSGRIKGKNPSLLKISFCVFFSSRVLCLNS